MNGSEHYRRAEQLLAAVYEPDAPEPPPHLQKIVVLLSALTDATLALAAVQIEDLESRQQVSGQVRTVTTGGEF